MYVDPEGEFLHLIVFVVVVLFLATTIALTPPEEKSGENISVSFSANPDPLAVGYEFLGKGLEVQYIENGTSCNIYGECSQFTSLNGQLGLYGASFTTSEGEDTMSYSYSIFYLSYDPQNILDINSWGGGISLGFSGGLPYIGSTSAYLDINLFGIIIDFFGVGSNGTS